MLLSASTNPPKTKQEMLSYIKSLDKTEVDFIHCDIMDGHFVKVKTFNHNVVKEISKITQKKLDVHLMVKNPSFKIKKYAHAGAYSITIHFEAYKNKKKLIKDLQKIKTYGCFAGLSFNPNTSVLDVLPFIYYCDILLVMSVIPGKSGQEFKKETLLRLDVINKFLKDQKLETVIEVDGGVNYKNLPLLFEKNVSSVVMGAYLYGSKNLKQEVKKIKNYNFKLINI